MATVTVREYERVVRFVDGRVRDVLGPGRHRYRPRRTELHRVDVRPRTLTVAGQEMLTSDGVSVRVTVTLRVRVEDPALSVTESQEGVHDVYLAAQLAVRALVAGRSLDDVLAARTSLGADLVAQVATAAARVGCVVDEAAVRDVMLPGELRRAYAETTLARERGRAERERARTEAATLRSLANTARLLEQHPALLRLRTLQVAEQDSTELRLTMGE